MKKVMYKLFWIWDFESEEKWINEMAADGWQLTDVVFTRYTFEKGDPGEYIYRIELLNDLPSTYKSMKYIEFMESTGITQVASYLRWVYFRKENDGRGFDLFSDIQSRINHLKRVLVLIGVSVLMLLFATIFGINGWQSSGETELIFWPILCGALLITILIGGIKILIKKNDLEKKKILHE